MDAWKKALRDAATRASVAEAIGAASISTGGLFAKPRYDFDVDLLDCPVCMKRFKSRVYQCENGHLACSSCWKKLTWANGSKCPSCSKPIGSMIRNLVVEKILESLKISCENAALGCPKMLRCKKQISHERKCPYIPFNCPIDFCTYHGPGRSFFDHFTEKHGFESVCMETESKEASFHVSQAQSHVNIVAKHGHYLLHHVKLPPPTNGDQFFITSLGKKMQYMIAVTIKDVDEDSTEDQDSDNDRVKGDDELEDTDEDKYQDENTDTDTETDEDMLFLQGLDFKTATGYYVMMTHTADIRQPECWNKHVLFIPEQPSHDNIPKPFNVKLTMGYDSD